LIIYKYRIFYITNLINICEVKTMNKELEKKEIERIIRYWQGKIKYAKMRIIENEKKLKKITGSK
tara:strand:- start:715 stop:909 length:195 start_codon:yes stop_codon:yes gene_type:complete